MAWSGARPVEWLLDARGTRCALVRRARDAHDRRRNATPRRERRDRGTRADHRGGSRRRHVRGARLPRRARRVRRRQRLEHLHRSRSPSCGSSSGRSGSRIASAQRARGRGRAGGTGALRGGGARWRDARSAGRRARLPQGCRADFVVLDPERARARRPARRRVLDAAVFGPCRAPVRDVMVGGRWIVRDGRHPHGGRRARPLSRVSGTIVVMNTAFDLLITGAHLATMEGDSAVRRDSRRRHRHRRRDASPGWAPSATCRATCRRGDRSTRTAPGRHPD